MQASKTKFSCIILAGGEGKRVNGQDKGLLTYKNKTLMQHVIDRVSPQVDEIIISANRNIEEYKKYDFQVISDLAEEYRGPMAGIAAALPYCKNEWVFVVACDMPSLPLDIIKRLTTGIDDSDDNDIVIVESEQRLQLVFLMRKKLQPSITRSLDENQLKLMLWIRSQSNRLITINDHNSFRNYNHSSDLT